MHLHVLNCSYSSFLRKQKMINYAYNDNPDVGTEGLSQTSSYVF